MSEKAPAESSHKEMPVLCSPPPPDPLEFDKAGGKLSIEFTETPSTSSWTKQAGWTMPGLMIGSYVAGKFSDVKYRKRGRCIAIPCTMHYTTLIFVHPALEISLRTA
jgi:hypothetical protein